MLTGTTRLHTRREYGGTPGRPAVATGPGGNPVHNGRMFEVAGFERGHLAGVLALCAAEGWRSLPADPQRAYRALSAPGVTTVVAVAESAGEVVGFAELFSDGELQSYLASLLVAPGWRGLGVGRVLVAEAFRRCGGQRIDLLSEDAAAGFYQALNHREKRGFRLYPPFTAGDATA